MPRTVSIGRQDFESIITNGYFYVDKTNFIREWWENGDSVTLITRPRRFGKALNMSMVEQFFRLIMQTGAVLSRLCFGTDGGTVGQVHHHFKP